MEVSRPIAALIFSAFPAPEAHASNSEFQKLSRPFDNARRPNRMCSGYCGWLK